MFGELKCGSYDAGWLNQYFTKLEKSWDEVKCKVKGFQSRIPCNLYHLRTFQGELTSFSFTQRANIHPAPFDVGPSTSKHKPFVNWPVTRLFLRSHLEPWYFPCTCPCTFLRLHPEVKASALPGRLEAGTKWMENDEIDADIIDPNQMMK